MRKITFSIILVAVAVLVNACAARVPQAPPQPATQMVTFNSEPQGARVIMNGQVIGTTPFMFPVPLTHHTGARTAEGVAAANQTRFTFIQDGFVQGEEIFQPVVTGVGRNQTLTYPTGVFHILRPQLVAQPVIESVAPPVVQQPAQPVVTREAPGATSLERTIIRWFVDSDPRGARISWRVISSIPEEVRNTNDTFLGTTPFEETRGFDILGLTYENAHNVSIEIRVESRDFHTQTRRFNVRQAIDQREISTFLELVPVR